MLAQYATPAELLMSPANDFVEDFVGADRALKRLSLLRVRDIDLWKAPLVRVGEPTAAVARARSPRRTCRTRSWSTTRAGPLGWMSERDLARETVPATPDTRPGPADSSSTTSCATRSRTCSSRTRQYGPVVDERGRVVGRALGRDHLRTS